MTAVPKIIFIVPYRNRSQHKYFFSLYMRSILAVSQEYEIFFSHQCDVRAFNRGATKNIGFLAVKQKYPNDYKGITLVFNDIDTVPYSAILDYETTAGVVKHFYGFKYALGGIVSITGRDFEQINGYPNFWGWGMEDNVLQTRCEAHNLTIDRTQFFPIGSPNIIHLFDGVSRIINRKDPWRATNDDGVDGIKSIHKLNFTIDKTSLNPADNKDVVEEDDTTFIVNIKTFMTNSRFEHDNYHSYDLREPPRKIIHPSRVPTRPINHVTDDWSRIPFYPTAQAKQDMVEQYGETKTDEIIQFNADNSVDPMTPIMPPPSNNVPAAKANATTNTLWQIHQYLAQCQKVKRMLK